MVGLKIIYVHVHIGTYIMSYPGGENLNKKFICVSLYSLHKQPEDIFTIILVCVYSNWPVMIPGVELRTGSLRAILRKLWSLRYCGCQVFRLGMLYQSACLKKTSMLMAVTGKRLALARQSRKSGMACNWEKELPLWAHSTLPFWATHVSPQTQVLLPSCFPLSNYRLGRGGSLSLCLGPHCILSLFSL